MFARSTPHLQVFRYPSFLPYKLIQRHSEVWYPPSWHEANEYPTLVDTGPFYRRVGTMIPPRKASFMRLCWNRRLCRARDRGRYLGKGQWSWGLCRHECGMVDFCMIYFSCVIICVSGRWASFQSAGDGFYRMMILSLSMAE